MITEPLDAFLNTAEFAETATFGATPIVGIFDNAFADAMGIAGSAPVFQCKSTDAASLSPGTSTLTIRSSSYLVIGVEADGTGISLVRLQEA